MLKGTTGERQPQGPEKQQGPEKPQGQEKPQEHGVFHVDVEALQSLRKTLQRPQQGQELVVANNTAVLVKFCDVCKRLNLDPLHAHALPCVVLLMSKNKHCVEMAHDFAEQAQCSDVLAAVDLQRESVVASCDQLLSSMADWLTLFSYLPLRSWDAEDPAQRGARQRLVQQLETNQVLKRMQASLAEAQVTAGGSLAHQQRSAFEVALLALLHLSPRCTTAGKMLERLYTDICEKARDAELRCLRVMTSFKDTMDDEEATTRTMQLVMQCFSVAPGFTRTVAAVLRKKMLEEDHTEHKASRGGRQLFRTYATQAVVQKRTVNSHVSLKTWVQQVSFPVNTSSHMQCLLYFFCVQSTPPALSVYEGLYTPELCKRSATIPVDVIDVGAIKMVIDSLRLYSSNVKPLIDFSAKCLQGINQQRRQKLSLVQVLQLYIVCYQHDSIWKELWRHVLEPAQVMNHTIASDCAAFRATHPYEPTAVAENLVRSLVDE
jgi:hypothetical protein